VVVSLSPLKMFRSRIHVVDARLWTWEVTTAFDEELQQVELQRRFATDFPKTEKKGSLIFWKMISFNGAEGRKHRYLVALRENENRGGCGSKSHRYLPSSLVYYGMCDRILRESESSGNLRFAFLSRQKLFVLVFLDGRLCHWSEEDGHDLDSAKERLALFDEFLNRDELFSREECFQKFFGDESQPDEKALMEENFWRGLKDPFWKGFSLNGISPQKTWRFVLCIPLAFLLVLPLALRLPKDSYEEKDDAVIVFQEKEKAEMPPDESVPVFQKSNPPPLLAGTMLRKSQRNRPCRVPSWRLKGVVENRVAQIHLPSGDYKWLKPGETFLDYKVLQIHRAGIVLACKGYQYEIKSGE